MIQSEINQPPVPETVFQAEPLWSTRTAASRFLSPLTRVSDTKLVTVLWRLLSLLLVPLAGALGGVLYSLTDQMRQVGIPEKLLENLISLLF